MAQTVKQKEELKNDDGSGQANEFESEQSYRMDSHEMNLSLQAFVEDSELFNTNVSLHDANLISYATAVPKYCEKLY